MKKEDGYDWGLNDRVKAVRESLKMTQQAFAEKLGHKTSNALSMLEKRKSKLTEYNIRSICNANQLQVGITVNKDWLLTGRGKMFITPSTAADGYPALYDDNKELLPNDERELIGTYRELIPTNKKNLRDLAKTVLATQNNTEVHILGEGEKGEAKTGISEAV